MSESPLVSIIVPNFNKEKFVKETLQSVQNQTYSNWECILVDDHSTDSSWQIIEKFAREDSRFKIYRRPSSIQKGGNHCRNYAVSLSKGDYFQFLDSDDLLEQSKLASQISQLTRLNDDYAISISNFKYFKPKSGLKYPLELVKKDIPNEGVELLLELWSKPFFIPPFSFVGSRKLFKRAGEWDKKLVQNQDGEYFSRVLLASSQVVFCSGALGYYRIPGQSNVSRIATLESFKSVFDSYVSYEKNLLKVVDKEEVRYCLSLNYSRLVHRSLIRYPSIAKLAFNRVKTILKGNQTVYQQLPISIRFSRYFGLGTLRAIKLMNNFLKN